MSMEPVAWAYSFKGKGPVLTDEKKDWANGSEIWAEEPLVRLSDAEARIEELQAKIEWLELEAEGHDNAKRDLAEVLSCADEPRWKWMRLEAVKLTARAEAAEALLKEAKTLAKIAIAAEKMMNGAAVYFAADGERDDAKKLTKAATIMGERARSIADKIGGKDE